MQTLDLTRFNDEARKFRDAGAVDYRRIDAGMRQKAQFLQPPRCMLTGMVFADTTSGPPAGW